MQDKEKPKVSVIIPVYNVEPYLRECMDSIIGQTLRDIEIICVNDGSTDGSLAILEEYRSEDPRVTIIDQENKGLSAARNRGLENAMGEYIYFVDSDDYADLVTLERTVRIANENDLDAVVFGFDRVSESGELLPHPFRGHELKRTGRILSGVSYIREAKENRVYTPGVWVVLWRRSFLRENGLHFKEGLLFEDNLFSFQAYMTAKRVLCIPDRFYKYQLRPESITTKPMTAENARCCCECAEGILEFAFHGPFSPEEEHEIQRAYTAFVSTAVRAFYAISPAEQKKVVFPREIENELFRQIVARDQADKLASELCTQQKRTNDLQREIDGLHMREERLKKEIDGLHMREERLKKEIDGLCMREERLKEEIDRQQDRSNTLQYDLDCVHASVSFRVGRAATWLPRKIRGGIRCYKEHGMG